MTNPARPDGPAASAPPAGHRAGPGLGGALAHRFAQGGYHLTLLARHTDGLAKLASDLAHAGAAASAVAADASDPEGLRATLTSLYASTGAPGVLAYNASMLTPGSLLSSDVARLHQAYDVDVVGAGGLGLDGSSWSCSSSDYGRGLSQPQTPSRSLVYSRPARPDPYLHPSRSCARSYEVARP